VEALGLPEAVGVAAGAEGLAAALLLPPPVRVPATEGVEGREGWGVLDSVALAQVVGERVALLAALAEGEGESVPCAEAVPGAPPPLLLLTLAVGVMEGLPEPEGEPEAVAQEVEEGVQVALPVPGLGLEEAAEEAVPLRLPVGDVEVLQLPPLLAVGAGDRLPLTVAVRHALPVGDRVGVEGREGLGVKLGLALSVTEPETVEQEEAVAEAEAVVVALIVEVPEELML
jgi:hypothetical protein